MKKKEKKWVTEPFNPRKAIAMALCPTIVHIIISARIAG